MFYIKLNKRIQMIPVLLFNIIDTDHKSNWSVTFHFLFFCLKIDFCPMNLISLLVLYIYIWHGSSWLCLNLVCTNRNPLLKVKRLKVCMRFFVTVTLTELFHIFHCRRTKIAQATTKNAATRVVLLLLLQVFLKPYL